MRFMLGDAVRVDQIISRAAQAESVCAPMHLQPGHGKRCGAMGGHTALLVASRYAACLF